MSAAVAAILILRLTRRKTLFFGCTQRHPRKCSGEMRGNRKPGSMDLLVTQMPGSGLDSGVYIRARFESCVDVPSSGAIRLILAYPEDASSFL